MKLTKIGILFGYSVTNKINQIGDNMNKIKSNIKTVSNEKYSIMFNQKTGVEILRGINGHEDPFILDYPSMIDVGIMGHCKNKCEFCYQGDNPEPNMKLEDFKKIVDESKPHVMQYALGGRGDPNHHEDFEEILKYCVDNDIVPNYTTSGINLTDRQVQVTKEYCGACAVSMYNNSYTFKALKMFMGVGMKTNIHYVLSTKSLDKALKMLDGEDIWHGEVDLKKLNAVVFLLFKPQGKGKNLTDWVLTNDQILKFIEKIRAPKTNYGVGMDSCLVCRVASNTELTDLEKLVLDTCEGSRMSSYMTPDLKFIPCSFENHDLAISVKDKSIKEVWDNSDLFKDFRKRLIKDKNTCPVSF